MMMVMMCLQTCLPHKMADIGITLSITRKGRVPGRRGRGEKNGQWVVSSPTRKTIEIMLLCDVLFKILKNNYIYIYNSDNITIICN
jgi:hypothetical protein